MERYHIYKLGLAILFYAVYFARQTVVNGLKIDDVTSTTNTTDYRERRDSGDDNAFFYQGADGTPGVDFPTLSYVPRTKFSCRDMEAGYYADVETHCQVFHICDEGRKLSFLCPNGTTFHQSELICDWWFKVNCSNSPSLYEESAEILHRENAKRKDNRRLSSSYQGTKQSVFSSREDYNNGQETFGGTPAHFVTPSYRSSVKTIDNRIYATTEGSVRINYNGRGDRTLDSFGNGVKERDYDKKNRFSSGNAQNNFGTNLQAKSGARDQTTIGTSSQQRTGSGQFSFSKDSHFTGSGGFTSGNFGRNGNQASFDRTSQQSIRGHDQTTFGSNLQSNSNGFAKSEINAPGGFGSQTSSQQSIRGHHQNTFGSNLQSNSNGFAKSEISAPGGFGSQTSSQQSIRGHHQNTFGSNLQSNSNGFAKSEISAPGGFGSQTSSQQSIRGHDQNTFGLQSNSKGFAKSETSAPSGFGSQISFDRNSQRTANGRNQGTFSTNIQNGFNAGLQGKSEIGQQATFGTGTHQVDSNGSFGTSSQKTTGQQNQNIFGSGSVQGNVGNFGVQTQGKSRSEEQTIFGVDHHSFGGQNTFGARLQGGSKPAQTSFGINLQGKSANTQEQTDRSTSQIPLNINSQQITGYDQNVFGRFGTQHTAGRTTTELPLDRSAHRASGRGQTLFGIGQATFGTNIQQTAGGSISQLPFDRSSQQISGSDQNVFGRGQITFGTSTQQTVGSSASQLPFDRSSQRTNQYDQNRFGSGKATFGANNQQIFGSDADRSRQNTNARDQGVFTGQVAFGTSTQQTTGSDAVPLDKSSQKASDYDRNTESRFSTNIQSNFDGSSGKITLDATSVAPSGRDQNRFGTSSQEKTNNGQFGTGLGATPSNLYGETEKIKFSISSQGKSDEFDTNKQQGRGSYQQNTFNANSHNQFADGSQTTVSRGSHITLGGVGQNRFDLNSQGKSGQFEPTTSSFGLKSSGTTQSAFSFASKTEQEDDGGKIPVLIVSAETQEPQESASFVKSGRNNLLDNNRQATTNRYPNHRETYTDIKDPRHYYQQPHSKLPEKPFYGSSVSPQVLSTVPVSANEGFRATTEVSPQKENTGSVFGFKADISTTEQAAVDVGAITTRRNVHGGDVVSTFTPFKNSEQLEIGKSPVTTNRFSFESNEPQTTKSSVQLESGTQQIDISTNRGINSFEQSTIPSVTKQATIGSNKVDVTTYDRGYVNGVDLTLNTISSTALPDISDDVDKSTVYPDSQKNNYYTGKNQFRFGTTEKPYGNSPIIKLNILSPTASPQFETSTRSGKAFNADSPKIQVITLDGSRTKDFSTGPFSLPGNGGDRGRISVSFGSGDNGRFTANGQTVSPGFIRVKTNGISSGGKGNSFRVVTGVNITPSVSITRFGSKTTSTGISPRTSSSIENNYDKNFVSTLSTQAIPLSTRGADINDNDLPSTFPAGDGIIGVTSPGGKVNVDIITSTRATPTEKETVELTINDEIFTTPTSDSTETINLNINNENHSTPASQYSVTREGGFGITATTVNPTRDDVLYTSKSTVLQPKPFSNTPVESESTEKSSFEQTGTPQVPPYTISSASPFATTIKSTSVFEPKTLTPTLPTPYTTESASSYSYTPSDENINNVINTLMGVVKQRFGGKDLGFGTPRPGLVVPPSAGPQTLHTLAIYFANALDNLTSSSPTEKPEETDEETGTNSPIIHIDNEELIKSLLTQMTLQNYETLFKEKDGTTTELPFSLRTGADDDENDLIREDTKHPTEGPGVRQLARVFTEALSAYLEDPDTFKKVLHDVRPTEPPPLASGNDTTEAEEDEVLNYSDSDLKSDHPHLPVRPTGIPVSPTWGYLLAFNKSSPINNNLESRNSLSSDGENLLSADSQSFVSQLNKVTQAFKTTLPLDGTKATTEVPHATGFTTGEETGKGLPENHWTTSSDVTKLWQTTLSINPAILNENFDSSQSGQGFTAPDVETRYSTATDSEDNSSESSSDSRETTGVSEIQYELRALPKIQLNSTQVHGILIDFMNATKSEGSEKLQRILHKLNISQDEFLNKMKEIEGNPLTRRLILLLISECNTDRNKALETRASVFGLNSDNTEQPAVTPLQLSTLDGDAPITESNSFKHIVHPSLADDDEDTRALELLNSLYVIASKFGK